VIEGERLTSVVGDIEAVIRHINTIRWGNCSVFVPRLETPISDGIYFQTDFVNKHVLRCRDPRKITDADVANPTDEFSGTRVSILERPAFDACERLFCVRIT